MNKVLLATAMLGALLISGCVYEPYRGYDYGDGYQNSRESNRNFYVERSGGYYGNGGYYGYRR